MTIIGPSFSMAGQPASSDYVPGPGDRLPERLPGAQNKESSIRR